MPIYFSTPTSGLDYPDHLDFFLLLCGLQREVCVYLFSDTRLCPSSVFIDGRSVLLQEWSLFQTIVVDQTLKVGGLDTLFVKDEKFGGPDTRKQYRLLISKWFLIVILFTGSHPLIKFCFCFCFDTSRCSAHHPSYYYGGFLEVQDQESRHLYNLMYSIRVIPPSPLIG